MTRPDYTSNVVSPQRVAVKTSDRAGKPASNGREPWHLESVSKRAFFRLVAVTLAGCTAIALLHTISQLLRLPENTFAWTFPRLLIAWVSGGIFVPGVLLVAKRVRFGRAATYVAVPVHAAAALAFTASHYALLSALHSLFFGTPESFRDRFRDLFLYYLHLDVITYGLIVGSVHAWLGHIEAKDRTLAAERLRADLNAAHLRALRAQLQPHFLFNAMNAIAMLVRAGQQDVALSTITSLSDLMRRILREPRSHEVTLREELDFVRQYLTIEQTRLGSRLSVKIDASEDTLDVAVPDLILQPLVENAVRHGASRTSRPCRISVSARRENGRLSIAVYDDAGELPLQWSLQSQGVGLRNTSARLAALHGEAANMLIARNAAGGCTATVTLPILLHHRKVSLHQTAP